MSYQTFFNLDETPFNLAPDPDYYFPSKRHNEALETLLYCVENGEGFAQITGRPGVGKTLLIRSFLDQLGDNVNTALILHPGLSAEELYKVILEDLGVASENMQGMSKDALLKLFREFLLKSAEEGRRTLVIIDEAQDIPENSLEELRLLSNLETNKAKLLQIILVGQLDFEKKLKQDQFNQLYQRITIRCRIEPLTLDETVNYIYHRLKIAGGGNVSRFNPKIIKQIHKISGGVPRLINTLCERSLMAAYVDGKSSVSREHLKNASQSLGYGEMGDTRTTPKSNWGFALAAILAMTVGLTYYNSETLRQLASRQVRQAAVLLENGVMQIAVPPKIEEGNVELVKGVEPASGEKKHEGDQELAGEATASEMSAIDREVGKTAGAEKLAVSSAEEETVQEESVLPEHVIPAAVTSPFGNLPTGWNGIWIQLDRHKAVVYQAGSPEAGKEVELPGDVRLEDGFYLLGQVDGKRFLFNRHSFYPWQVDSTLTGFLLEQLDREALPPVTPVIVSTSASLDVLQVEDLADVRALVTNWAEAHGNKDVEEVTAYYDDPLVGYTLFRNRPAIKSHTQVQERKKGVFEKNKAVLLQTSDPVSLVENGDPTKAVALFFQRFVSSTYHDSGVKVLYLRKDPNATPDKREWLITGTLWIPSPKRK